MTGGERKSLCGISLWWKTSSGDAFDRYQLFMPIRESREKVEAKKSVGRDSLTDRRSF